VCSTRCLADVCGHVGVGSLSAMWVDDSVLAFIFYLLRQVSGRWRCVEFRAGTRLRFASIFTAVMFTEPPIRWLPRDVSLELKWQAREAYNSHPHSAGIVIRGSLFVVSLNP
jgi:hypothetical protein